MSTFEAIIMGLVQGLTEFLPVSSSGHLAIAKALFGIESGNLSFEIVVHAATVLSTILVFRVEIWDLIKEFFKFKYNFEMQYILKIGVSMIPVLLVGLFLKNYITEIFGSGLIIVGIMLFLTAILLLLGEFLSNRQLKRKMQTETEGGKEVGYWEAFIIGIAQAFAVMPGLSRSGTTIATGLMMGVKKNSATQFSFLMVLIPILGETFLDLIGGNFSMATSGIAPVSLLLGSFTAFVSGYAACRWMISLVKKARLRYFSIYCVCAAIFCIVFEAIK